MKPQTVLVDAAAFRGELLDMLLAGMSVLIVLAIVGLMLDLRRRK